MTELFGNFYRGKRVLVTGHTGFKGSWLAIWLHEMGAEVTGIGLEPYGLPGPFCLFSCSPVGSLTFGLKRPFLPDKSPN